MLNLTVSGAGQAMLAVYFVWRAVEVMQAHPTDGWAATGRRVLMNGADLFTLLLGNIWVWIANMVLSTAWMLFSRAPEVVRVREEAPSPMAVRVALWFAVLVEAAFYFGFQAIR